MSETKTIRVTASAEWVARDMLRMARDPSSNLDELTKMLVGYFDQVATNASKALREYAELEASWSLACDRRRPGWTPDDPMHWVNKHMGEGSLEPVGAFLASKRREAMGGAS